jgi:TetR/AcrR family transcriptional regulator
MSWAEERAVERSAAVQRSRTRIAEQVRLMLDAAGRLIETKGDAFTTQELVKEAGVALQTFYRYFSSKDELLLAVISDAMTEACARWERGAVGIPDPLDRVRYFITSILGGAGREPRRDALAQFMVTTHWRLHRVFPDELAAAEKPLVDLLCREIQTAVDTGQLTSTTPEVDAWFVAELVRSVYHHYAFASDPGGDVQEHLWLFCLRALGGARA